MRRFFIEELDPSQERVAIAGSEAKHITKVLRMKPGDSFELMDARGTRCLAHLVSGGPREVTVRIIQALPTPPPSPVEIVLCQSLLKSRHMDYLVEKASELGADRLIPFSSKRSLVTLETKRIAGKIQHWRGISRSAAKQSGRGIPIAIDEPTSFHKLMEQWQEEHAAKALLWEEEDTQDLKGLLTTPAKRFVGVVGPEGGFEPHEVQLAKQAGFETASMGHRILRAETAGIALVAVVQFTWGDLGRTPE